MKYLKTFNLFESSKHQGEEVFPKLVYHKSNPIFRNKIEKEGLKPMKGDSYSIHSPEESEIPAIFGYVGDIDYYDSTYDDDIWEINCTNLKNKWYVDKEVGGHIQSAVMTFESIPITTLKLIYKGTGNPY